MRTSVLRSLILAAAFFSFDQPLKGSEIDPRTAKLVKSLELHEERLSDLDVKFSTVYQSNRPVFGGNSSDKEYREVLVEAFDYHAVFQGDMFRVSRTGCSELETGDSLKQNMLYTFDGSILKQLIQDKVVNIHEDYSATNERVFYPHSLPLSMTSYKSIPLSRYLKETGKEYKYTGDQSYNGTVCHVIEVKGVSKKTHETTTLRRLYLSKEKSMLPVYMECYDLRFSNEMPTVVCEVTKFLELGSKSYCPSELTIIKYDKFKLKNPGILNIIWTNVIKVSSASLGPEYPVSFYREFDIPNGAKVYKIKDGKITDSWKEPRDSDDSDSDS